MNFPSLISQINEHVTLSEEEVDFLESVVIPRPFTQGELIIKNGEVARYMMFVKTGYLMTYYTDDAGVDHVVQFAGGGWWCGDIHSVSQQPNPVTLYSTRGLSDGQVLLLPRLTQQQLLERYPVFERYFRITFQNSFMKQQFRFIESYSATAEKRYQKFIASYPTIEQYVSQKY